MQVRGIELFGALELGIQRLRGSSREKSRGSIHVSWVKKKKPSISVVEMSRMCCIVCDTCLYIKWLSSQESWVRFWLLYLGDVGVLKWRMLKNGVYFCRSGICSGSSLFWRMNASVFLNGDLSMEIGL